MKPFYLIYIWQRVVICDRNLCYLPCVATSQLENSFWNECQGRWSIVIVTNLWKKTCIMEWNFKVEPTEQDAKFNFSKVRLYFLLGRVISGLPFNLIGTRVCTKQVRQCEQRVTISGISVIVPCSIKGMKTWISANYTTHCKFSLFLRTYLQ